MKFTKLEGAGNDFILIDARETALPQDLAAFARRICHRHFGIGGDGVLLLFPSDRADLRMVILNSDGSEAQMCGNGIRCFALYAYEKGLVGKEPFAVETAAGIIKPQLIFDGEKVSKVRVDMGAPEFQPDKIPVAAEGSEVLRHTVSIDGTDWTFSAVSMGNPHCVLFVDEPAALVGTLGPILEGHPLFPARTNVEFVRRIGPAAVEMRVYERGCGETLACGTGGAAAVAAGIRLGLLENSVTVHLPGGDLEYSWEEDGHLWMTGPVRKVARGEYDFED